MFKPTTLKVFSIVAMILSAIGLLVSIIMTNQGVILFVSGITSWIILFWASYIGFKLSSYKLYENEYKKVGIRVYLIILAFVLFSFVGIIIGLALSVVLLSTLWGLKGNYDDWNKKWNSTTTDIQ